MKPHQKTARLRRKVAVMVYKNCPTPEKFENVLHGIPDLEKRAKFYYAWRSMLSFRPRSLEEINASRSQ